MFQGAGSRAYLRQLYGTGWIHFPRTDAIPGYSIAIGLGAMPHLPPGQGAKYFNVAIGGLALSGNLTTAAIHNMAIGGQALLSNTSGANNVAVGNNALVFNTTGSDNVGVGSGAGQANDVGSFNTNIGFQAGQFNKGSQNTFIGLNAGAGVNGSSTMSDTTLVGFEAGFVLTTGIQNTCLGSLAGSNLVAGSGNIIIGYNRLGPTGASQNCLNIGDVILGTGTNVPSTSTITFPGNVIVQGTLTPTNTGPTGKTGSTGATGPTGPGLTGATGATGGGFLVGNMIINYGEAAAPPAAGVTATFKIPYVDNPPFVTLGGATGSGAGALSPNIRSVSKTGVAIENANTLAATQCHYIAIGT